MDSSVLRIFGVALAVCIVCSIVVSTASVGLRGYQEANKKLDRQRNVLAAAGLLPKGANADTVQAVFEQIQVRLVDLRTGHLVSKHGDIGLQLSDYDVQLVSRDERFSDALQDSEDIAGIVRRERYAQVYLVQGDNRVKSVIFPIRGYGLWSTLYGFIALKADLNTVIGLGFWQHGETPGLGGEVDNPSWKARWRNKRLYLAKDGAVSHNAALTVGKKPSSHGERYHVDGLSGATITSRGVQNMIRYWFGQTGYGPFLNYVKSVGLDEII